MAERTIKLGSATVSYGWNVLDRAIEVVAPAWAGRRLQARVGHALTASMSGGGYNGASSARRSLSGWHPIAGDADSDTLGDLATLRARSRDLARNSPIAVGAIGTTVTHVVGSGLSLQPAIDAKLLGLSQEQADDWHYRVSRDFEAWASSKDCDVHRTLDFYALQQLAMRAVCESGDMGVLLTSSKSTKHPIALALQAIEADRICNPNRAPDTADMVAGISFDEQGAPREYHVASGNPHRRGLAGNSRPLSWTSVPAFGAQSGRRNFLHLFEQPRPGQRRGVPMLAPVIEPLKQLERYTEAELMAAVVSGMFTVFIQTEGSTQLEPSALAGGQAPAGGSGGWNGKLGNGLVVELNKGESINTANPGRPNANFDPFVNAIVRQIGLALQIPYEVLVKAYMSSYSAARAALLDAWRFFRARRDWLVVNLCQPVYEAWLEEGVALGRIAAPGFFADPLIRKAWAGATWVGDGPGAIDPLKEVLAAKERVALSTSTLSQESILHDGIPWERKVDRREREEERLRRAGLPSATAPAPATDAPPPSDEPPRRSPAEQAALAAAYHESTANN